MTPDEENAAGSNRAGGNAAGDSRFAPSQQQRQEAVGGLQRNPDWQATAEQQPAQPASPWQRSNETADQVGSGDPATELVVEEAPTIPAPTLPKVPLSEVVFGGRVPWRVVALGCAGILALGGIGGFIGGFAGKSYRADYQRVELQPVEGRGQQLAADAEAGTGIGDVADRVMPSVVSISVAAAGMSGVGSGIVIDPQGFILTNNHVVSFAAEAADAEILVRFQSGGQVRQAPAELIGRDPMTDLAVLKVNDVAGLTVAELADSDQVRVGDLVIAVGSPQGLQGTVTTGIVSALNRPVRLSGEGSDTDGVADAIQTDASINPGNSGGPLVDARGAVIGINTVIFSVSGGSQGLGFAIPMNSARAIAEQLINGGHPRHPSIGVTSRTAESGAQVGAEVATVVSGSPADVGGLHEGDIVVAVGDRAVESSDELIVAIWTEATRIGQTDAGELQPVVLHVIRDGQQMQLQIAPEWQ